MTAPVCIIPVRMNSSRFPGKPLVPLLGMPMVLHIYARCRLAAKLGPVVVATCDQEIKTACEDFGATVVMTDESQPSALHRTQQAIANFQPDLPMDAPVLMVQGDEILFGPDMGDSVADRFAEGDAEIVNVVSPIIDDEDLNDPNRVKVVATPAGKALYFSRAPIPACFRNHPAPAYQQTGIIGFTKSFINTFGELPPTPLERAEQIDILRGIEHGFEVSVVTTDRPTLGVDTPADRDRAEALLKEDPWTRHYLEMAQ
jgi:3-deoxy-manno-octulosonate cytidylyltransferase (CMP-KDO synthetase)